MLFVMHRDATLSRTRVDQGGDALPSRYHASRGASTERAAESRTEAKEPQARK
jgi:hypothetical protein